MFNSIKKIIGISETEEDFDILDEVEDENLTATHSETKQKGNKIINVHNNNTARIMVTKPTGYDEATEIAEALKSRKILVVNTTSMDIKIAQRLVDFLGGACIVLGADIQEIETRVYLISPSNVEVTNEFKTEISSKDLFGWTKSTSQSK